MAVEVGGMSIAWPAFFIGMRSEEKLPVAGFLYDIKVFAWISEERNSSSWRCT